MHVLLRICSRSPHPRTASPGSLPHAACRRHPLAAPRSPHTLTMAEYADDQFASNQGGQQYDDQQHYPAAGQEFAPQDKSDATQRTTRTQAQRLHERPAKLEGDQRIEWTEQLSVPG